MASTTTSQGTVSLEDARRVTAAGEEAAREIGQPQNIAVVDAGGNLVSHIRMDGAWIGSVDIAINKAFTARAFDLTTAELAADSQPGGEFYGIQESNKGRVMIFAGGIPLKRDGEVVGAVGVSGGDGEQDTRSPRRRPRRSERPRSHASGRRYDASGKTSERCRPVRREAARGDRGGDVAGAGPVAGGEHAAAPRSRRTGRRRRCRCPAASRSSPGRGPDTRPSRRDDVQRVDLKDVAVREADEARRHGGDRPLVDRYVAPQVIRRLAVGEHDEVARPRAQQRDAVPGARPAEDRDLLVAVLPAVAVRAHEGAIAP